MFSSFTNNYNTLKSNINNSLEKLPNTKILKKTEKPKPKYLELTWRFYRNVSYIIVFLSFIILKYVYDIFIERGADDYVLKLYRILSFFIILNLVTYCFLLSYYKYRSSVKGIKGPKGKRGKRGPQGESESCNICVKKVGTFRRNRKVHDKKEYIKEIPTVDFENEKSTGWYTLKNKYKYDCNGNKTFTILNRTELGPNRNNQTNQTTQTNINARRRSNNNQQSLSNLNNFNSEMDIRNINQTIAPSNNLNKKPIIGAAANFSRNNGTLYTLQYMYDKNKEHDPLNHKVGLLGGPNGKFGINEDKGEKHNFLCPPNSAIYRVDTVSDPKGIKGVKYYCQDVKTGKQVKVLNNDNKEVNGVVFGIEPKPDTKTLNYQSTQCKSAKIKVEDTIHKNGEKTDITYRKIIPSFFSDVGASSDNNNIINLKFNECSYYRDWELSPQNQQLTCNT